ncbi:hypothetical protein V7266_03240 [Neobacillus drentensis]|uniref:hypothetical protein n=1 Tax=Neobacillus drentensis TaxID=220684 RepID=UPI003000A9AB
MNKWQTATLDLPVASFTNRENGYSDMRIVSANKLPLIIASIKLDAVPVNPPVSLWSIQRSL